MLLKLDTERLIKSELKLDETTLDERKLLSDMCHERLFESFETAMEL